MDNPRYMPSDSDWWDDPEHGSPPPDTDDYGMGDDDPSNDDYEGYNQAYSMWEQAEEGRNRRRNEERYEDWRRLPPDHPVRRAHEEEERHRRATEANTSDDGWNPFGDRGEPGYGYGGGAGGGSGGYGGGGGDANSWNDFSSGIPVLSWLLGQDQDEANSRAAADLARHEGYWGSLVGMMPTEDELSVEYRPEDYVGDTTREGALARGNWTDWAEGGFTDADLAMMEEARRREGRAARADREANLSALEARGMGGSGASLAAMLSAGEGAADRGAAMDATMMGAAQQRQIGATGALADWAAGETDYRRGREGRNTDRENRTRESAAEAAQRAHENRRDIVAGLDNQYSRSGAEDDDSDEAAAGFIEGLVSELGDII